MKKIWASFVAGIMFLLALFSAACEISQIGYSPSNDEIKANLEKEGYEIEFFGNFNGYFVLISHLYVGTLIKATKGSEYLYFSRFENEKDGKGVSTLIKMDCEQEQKKKFDVFVSIENDINFGNLVYAGTRNAVKAAGIKVVKVDVKI